MRLCQLAPCFKATWDSEVQACTEGIWISYSRCGKTIKNPPEATVQVSEWQILFHADVTLRDDWRRRFRVHTPNLCALLHGFSTLEQARRRTCRTYTYLISFGSNFGAMGARVQLAWLEPGGSRRSRVSKRCISLCRCRRQTRSFYRNPRKSPLTAHHSTVYIVM